jgi:hypothetical protein
MHIQTTRAFVLLAALPLLAGSGGAGAGKRPAVASAESNAVASFPPVMTPERVYEVHKKVRDFPPGEDLSTPEAAYASIHRAYAAKGDAAWMSLSSPEIVADLRRRGFQPRTKGPLPPEEAQLYLNAEILEVHTWDQVHAVIIAHMRRKGHDIDYRWLLRVKGRWLNEGNGYAHTVEEARKEVARGRAYQVAQQARENRPAVADPAARLQPFVDFLKREAIDPQQFLLQAIWKHRVVILGEIHHLAHSWAFATALVGAPEFARRAGAIDLELPCNDQPLVDRFLAAAKYDPAPVVETLRDMSETGSPDQPILDFFRTVWELNQKLPGPQRLRINLVDMARPWKEIRRREDWRKYDVDRNRFMAENVVRDLEEHAADKRHVLFIVGFAHAWVNLTSPGGEPMKSAGWHLRQKLGEQNVFAVIPHGPVQPNVGEASGRRAMGLFDTAFAAVGNKPMAFPLDRGPFGKELFDPDPMVLTCDPYGKGFHAYLFLGPLEEEMFCPAIPGYFSDEFLREVDRRWRINFGKGLVEMGFVKRLDAANFRAAEGYHCGQPRRDWSADRLPPLDAWKYGSQRGNCGR